MRVVRHPNGLGAGRASSGPAYAGWALLIGAVATLEIVVYIYALCVDVHVVGAV